MGPSATLPIGIAILIGTRTLHHRAGIRLPVPTESSSKREPIVEVASIDQTFRQATTTGFLLSEKTLRPLPWRDLNDSLQHATLRRGRRSPSGPAFTELLVSQRAPAPFAARVGVPNKKSEQRNASLCLSRYGGTVSHVTREWLNCSTGSVSVKPAALFSSARSSSLRHNTATSGNHQRLGRRALTLADQLAMPRERAPRPPGTPMTA